MDTTTAAAQAHVSIPTIRAWARYGAITATKTNRRWDIDEDSLAHRIALSRARKSAPTLNAETAVKIGGSRWTRGDRDRVYFNDWTDFGGLRLSHYNTGNISGSALDGYGSISHAEAKRILDCVYKVYYDVAAARIVVQLNDTRDPRVLSKETLAERIRDGIHAAVAAL